MPASPSANTVTRKRAAGSLIPENDPQHTISDWLSSDIQGFQKQLLNWFAQEKRLLPWRTQTSLYRTVVSEFMLQQTRVDTVIRYFEEWMIRFPDFQTLAKASEEEVLKAWEGLGYYRRARNLHALARHLAPLEEIPTEESFWLSLPGIGPYSAAAIRSIALGQPAACVDGNIVRILTRLTTNETVFRDSSTAARQLATQADALLSHQSPGAFNEAMMELGATVCVPRKPLCLVCPVKTFCKSHTLPHLSEIPRFRKAVFVEKQAKRLFLHHPQKGVLLSSPVANSKRLQSFLEIPHLPAHLDSHPKLRKLFTGKRGISQERWTEEILTLPITPELVQWSETETGLQWISLPQLEMILLSGPHRKWLNELLTEQHLFT